VRITLVNMPWALVDFPSLALGILRSAVTAQVPDAEVTVVHANLDYFDWAVAQDLITFEDYQYYSVDSYYAAIGDWVFASALYDDPHWRTDALLGTASMAHERQPLSIELHRRAPEFIDALADRVLADHPDVVGFTSTFQQSTAALAAARAIKRAAPTIRVVFGGANCDGEQGAALHRNFGFVDFVVRGEGEVAFPQLLAELNCSGGPDAANFAGVAGLCWRGPAGAARVNPMARGLMGDKIITPDYDGYFERFESSAAQSWVEPKLVVEGARGCWWGQKHHCTFCGLNGSFMEFRSKTADRFYDEIVHFVQRHRVLDMYVVDNILDMSYLTTLLPRLAASGYDLRLFVEIKANLRRDQLMALATAGLVGVQPGIESFSTRVLRIMDKGVTGCQNVRMLRDSAGVGLTPLWNYLYGFPGEGPDDYRPVIAQFPALHHLTPHQDATRIVVERFSPYFNRPELGFPSRTPAESYGVIYDLPEAELMDLAFIFSAPPQGIDESVADELHAATDEWQRAHTTSHLSYVDAGDSIVLVNRRRHFDWTTLVVDDPLEMAAFRLLDQPRTPATMLRALDASVPEDAVAELLSRWLELGIVFTDDGHYVHVVPVANNAELLRLEPHNHDIRLIGHPATDGEASWT
jgi:ribosomal peptide maturation radical SAM protein 1